jgi:hypothetical protein
MFVRPPVQSSASLGMPCGAGASGQEIFAPYGPSSTYITNSLGSSSVDDGSTPANRVPDAASSLLTTFGVAVDPRPRILKYVLQ